jgi:hypothetical protein
MSASGGDSVAAVHDGRFSGSILAAIDPEAVSAVAQIPTVKPLSAFCAFEQRATA